MALQKLDIKPGIFRNNTNYASEGRYYSGDKVRFRAGVPEKIGGWSQYSDATYVGTCRGLFSWNLLEGAPLLAIGTTQKYYIDDSGVFNDVTPILRTASLTGAALSLTNGSPILTITDAHTAGLGDYLTITGAVTFGGVNATYINKEHKITLAANGYVQVVLDTNATSNAAGGAGAITVAYQINIAPEAGTIGYGWGAGVWSGGTWGTHRSSGIPSAPRLWAQTAFGSIHVFAPVGGKIYYHIGTDLSSRALPLSGFSGASDVPLMALDLLMSASERHLIALGCNIVGGTELDPLLVRWSDTEDLANWTPSSVNSAGDLRVTSGNLIVCGVNTKQETLIFTDGSLHSMQFVGAPYTFGITPVGDNISIASKNATATANNIVYWMGTDKFYKYSGNVATLICDLQEFVFSDINMSQLSQVYAGTNEGFGEIWWHYPSKNSNVVDKYVVFNYQEEIWYPGTMGRSAWLDCPSRKLPIAAMNGVLYNHEIGTDDGFGIPMYSFIETADFDLQDGDSFAFITRILPDVNFGNSNAINPQVTLTLTPRNSPGGAYAANNAKPVTSTIVDVTQYTEQCHVRLRGRQMKFKIESNQVGCQWRLGATRVDIKPDGKK